MKFMANILVWLELLGLSVWIGGMIILGGLVAPAVFGQLPVQGAGGELMSTLFTRFNSLVAGICLGLIGIGFVGKVLLIRSRKWHRVMEGTALAILLGSAVYLGGILTPEMEQIRQTRIQNPDQPQLSEQFDAHHRTSERLFVINLFLGLGVFYLNALQITRDRAGRTS